MHRSTHARTHAHLLLEAIEQRRRQTSVGVDGVHDDHHPEAAVDGAQPRVRAEGQAHVNLYKRRSIMWGEE